MPLKKVEPCEAWSPDESLALVPDSNIMGKTKVAPADVLSKRVLDIKNARVRVTDEMKAKAKQQGGLFSFHKTPQDILFGGNAIISTNYTWWNFIAKNLLEQLTPWLKPANFYFLCIAVMQCIPEISTTQGQPTILLGLGFVLFVTMIKDGLEDYGRYKQDKIKNDAVYEVYQTDSGQWKSMKSKQLVVGDLIRIEDDGRIPADVIILASGIDSGTHAFVDTKDLDGETNLKAKNVPVNVFNWACGQDLVDNVGELSYVLSCDEPNGDVSEWAAGLDMGTTSENLDIGHLIMGGCFLRNTGWVIASVCYTGEHTKIRKNMAEHGAGRYKSSSVFRLSNICLVIMAFVQLVICVVACILSTLFYEQFGETAWYLKTDGMSPLWGGFLSFFTWIIISKDVVPIALYVSLEISHTIQSIFIYWDSQMSVWREEDGKEKRVGAKAQTSRLNEQLAQISYIFSDKTGTLTQNSMEFKKTFIGQTQYGSGTTIAGVVSRAKAKGENVAEAVERHSQLHEADKGIRGYTHPHVEFNEEEVLCEALIPAFDKKGTNDVDIEQAELVLDYVMNLGLNNSIFPKTKGDLSKIDKSDPNNDLQLEMQSSSPDETALAYFAQFAGFELYSRQGGIATLRVTHPKTKQKSFQRFKEILTINFSSKRKRMTVILQRFLDDDKLDDELIVYCKGADSFVKKLMDKGQDYLSAQLPVKGKKPSTVPTKLDTNWDETSAHLSEYCGESLRCLVLASARRNPAWFFGKGGKDPNSLQNRYSDTFRNQGPSEKGHDYGACEENCAMCAIEWEIETSCSLDLVGTTAIEDKLQDGVPQCLASLLEAGINVWVLTGDNVETAVNIGVSCNLLDGDMEQDGRLFKFDSDVDTAEIFYKRLAQYKESLLKFRDRTPPINFGVALHGDVWKLILANGETMIDEFFQFAKNCKSVLACRMEPKEKADIVSIVRVREKCTVLAIGDGNNDAPMIKIADVGVGIRGVEGTSAVAVSDYAISQFRFLGRLMLVHGHWSANRICTLVLYVYYKATMLVLMTVFFGFYSGFSGQMLLLDWAYHFQNMFFTAMPIVIFATFERNLSQETLMQNPKIYGLMKGKNSPTIFNMRIFAHWQLMAVVQTFILFFIPWYAYATPQDSSGQAHGFLSRGGAVYTCLVAVINNHLLIRYTSWTWVHHFWFWGTFAFWFGSMAAFSDPSLAYALSLSGINYNALYYRMWETPLYWLVTFMAITTAFLVDYSYVATTRVFYPTPIERYREAQVLGKLQDETEETTGSKAPLKGKGKR